MLTVKLFQEAKDTVVSMSKHGSRRGAGPPPTSSSVDHSGEQRYRISSGRKSNHHYPQQQDSLRAGVPSSHQQTGNNPKVRDSAGSPRHGYVPTQSYSRSRYETRTSSRQPPVQQQMAPTSFPTRNDIPVAPSTGQMRSGHIEVDTLFGSGSPATSQGLVVNAMNAPNNSTMQCGCENIDCPFCNLMMSVQMKGAGGF